VEADDRKQSSKHHTWHDATNGGFHGLGVLSRELAGRDAAQTFADCTGHIIMNNARDMTSLMANKGKMAYTRKRQRLDGMWGRSLGPENDGNVLFNQYTIVFNVFILVSPVIDSDGSSSSDDEADVMAVSGQCPWQMNDQDKALYLLARSRCPTWASDSSGFRMPRNIVNDCNRLKIHDWMVLSGSMQAYFVEQFTGITPEYKVLLADYFYMLEVSCSNPN
jgi:hypothetical protein